MLKSIVLMLWCRRKGTRRKEQRKWFLEAWSSRFAGQRCVMSKCRTDIAKTLPRSLDRNDDSSGVEGIAMFCASGEEISMDPGSKNNQPNATPNRWKYNLSPLCLMFWQPSSRLTSQAPRVYNICPSLMFLLQSSLSISAGTPVLLACCLVLALITLLCSLTRSYIEL